MSSTNTKYPALSNLVKEYHLSPALCFSFKEKKKMRVSGNEYWSFLVRLSVLKGYLLEEAR